MKIKKFTESKESIRLREQSEELGINNLIWDNKDIEKFHKKLVDGISKHVPRKYLK
jgi:hypothetical protein